eukprot:TRINITY_DN3784_c0_g1_i3.p1 TRINITY_DN3784_c0_g1~~TRINITY_DN3784_c0_g1_i3.p1  ORF type:complete len:320 (-),score=31.13 TRINITY_DN3784_c0_g1_i3:12-971(-)
MLWGLLRLTGTNVGRVVSNLERLGVGHSYGVVDVLHLQTTKPRLVNKKKKRFQITDRMSTEEIHELVDSSLHLTFDYMSLMIIASIIVVTGLVTNSSVVVVAGMLISPLMGPLLGMTFGTITHDFVMVRKGTFNEFIGILLAFAVGAISGLLIAFLFNDLVVWGQEEMKARGSLDGTYSGIVVAAASGLGVGFSVSTGGISAMIGIAISASLLPPICNAGLNLSYGMVVMYWGTGLDGGAGPSYDNGTNWLHMSLWSMLIFAVNLLLIYICGLFVFWLKRIQPPLPDPALAKFLEEDSPSFKVSSEDTEIPLLSTLVDK